MFSLFSRSAFWLLILFGLAVTANDIGFAAAPSGPLHGFGGTLPEVWWKAPIAAPTWDLVPLLAATTQMRPPILTVLLCLHVLGLALGLGGALFLDFYLVRHLYNRAMTPQTIEIVGYGTGFVAIGLAALWISGLGFLLFYALQAPANLANPKLWVKLLTVCVLTANGYFIHRVTVSRLTQNMGAPLLAGQPLARALPLLIPAAVSSVSWVFAFGLGMVRELNFATSAWILGASYLFMLVGAGLLATVFHSFAGYWLASRAGQHEGTIGGKAGSFDGPLRAVRAAETPRASVTRQRWQAYLPSTR